MGQEQPGINGGIYFISKDRESENHQPGTLVLYLRVI